MTLDSVARRQRGLVTVRQLYESGLTRSQVRARVGRNQLRPVRNGVFAVTPAPTSRAHALREWVRAALLTLPSGSSACSLTAAALFGWESSGLLPHDGLIHIQLPPGSRRSPAKGTRLHTSRASVDTIDVDGIRCVHPVTLLGELARKLPLVESTVMAESAFRGEPSLRDLASPLPLARGLSESALEAIALVLWHLGGLPAPIQQAIVRSGGRFLARVDFLWPEAMLVVEVDGMGKYAEPFALREEKRRQNNLVADGYLVLRFTWDDIVRRPNVVVHRIAAVLGVPFTELAADWARSGRK